VAHPRVDAIVEQARAAVAAAQSSSELEAIRVGVLGRQGSLTQLLRSLGSLPAEERPLVGAAANEAKRELEGLLDARLAATAAAERQAERSRRRLDLTLPGRRPPKGSLHPLTRVHDEIVAIFAGLGFSVAEGPEIESDYHNFEALNIPRDHPARDMQDTFYLSDSTLLRTHTSPVQIRAMLAQKPPVRIIVPGKVYRRDVVDMTHSPMFHQVEGLAVDRGITMADLKGTLELFAREMFGPRSRIRFRPSFFPFTEPSAEVDVLCLPRRGLPRLQADRLARDPRLGHGASASPGQRRLRSGGGHRLGVRHGHRAHRDAQVRHRRPPPVLRERSALPRAVRVTG